MTILTYYKINSPSIPISDEVILTTSRYGKPVIIIGEHRYNLNSKYKADGGKRLFCCSKRHCRASLVTVGDEIVLVRAEHNHIGKRVGIEG